MVPSKRITAAPPAISTHRPASCSRCLTSTPPGPGETACRLHTCLLDERTRHATSPFTSARCARPRAALRPPPYARRASAPSRDPARRSPWSNARGDSIEIPTTWPHRARSRRLPSRGPGSGATRPTSPPLGAPRVSLCGTMHAPPSPARARSQRTRTISAATRRSPPALHTCCLGDLPAAKCHPAEHVRSPYRA
jgi:hypothetical protein